MRWGRSFEIGLPFVLSSIAQGAKEEAPAQSAGINAKLVLRPAGAEPRRAFFAGAKNGGCDEIYGKRIF